MFQHFYLIYDSFQPIEIHIQNQSALKPLRMTFDLYFLHKSVVNDEKELL